MINLVTHQFKPTTTHPPTNQPPVKTLDRALVVLSHGKAEKEFSATWQMLLQRKRVSGRNTWTQRNNIAFINSLKMLYLTAYSSVHRLLRERKAAKSAQQRTLK